MTPARDSQRPRSAKDYLGAILAAGRGTRLEPMGVHYPKPILPVCNKPLVCYQIELMRSLGIEEILILIGHKGYEIARVLGDGQAFGARLRYVEQTEQLGIAHAVGRLEPHADRPILLFLGDIFFVAHDLGEMFETFEEQGGGAVLATREEADPEAIRRNFSVQLAEDGRVTRVMEKPRYTTNRLKGVGVYLLDLTVFDAIRRTPRTAMRDEYEITDSIQVMIDDGYPVRTARVIAEDINITSAADLLAINLAQARATGTPEIVGPGCRLHPGVRVEGSILGPRVTVAHPIVIRRSVVFEGTRIDTEEPIEDAIVTPEVRVRCPPPGR